MKSNNRFKSSTKLYMFKYILFIFDILESAYKRIINKVLYSSIFALFALVLLVLSSGAKAHDLSCQSLLKTPPSKFESHPQVEILQNMWLKAHAKWTDIELLNQNGQIHHQDFELIRKALFAHHKIFVKARQPQKLKLRRHLHILEQIARFDSKQLRISNYRVRRAIQGEFAISEYLRCQEP